MPLTRAEKEAMVRQLAQAFAQAQGTIMTDFRGLSVSEMDRLRRALDRVGVRYQVVKNTLAKLAMEQAGLTFEPDLFDGPTAVAFAREDLIAAARAISDYAKDARAFGIRGGLMDGSKLSAQEIERLAGLPGLQELRARLVSALSSPRQGLVGLLSGPQRGLLQVLRARAHELEQAA